MFHSQASKERRMDEAAPSQAFQTVHECVSVGVGVYVIVCVYASHHCDNACGAQPVTRKCFARRYNSCVNRRSLEEPVAGASWGPRCGASQPDVPWHNTQKATCVKQASHCYRVLTWYETPARLKEIPDGLEQMDAEELRVLVIKGIADGNDLAARSQFLHATDCLGEATKIFAERTHIYQPVIVRWPIAAVHDDFRWDIGGGNGTAR